jgi:hypothetical protein
MSQPAFFEKKNPLGRAKIALWATSVPEQQGQLRRESVTPTPIFEVADHEYRISFPTTITLVRYLEGRKTDFALNYGSTFFRTMFSLFYEYH